MAATSQSVTRNALVSQSQSVLRCLSAMHRLIKENEGNKKATFLDMETSVIDRRFITKAYDKREGYAFEIINYPELFEDVL